MNNYFIINENGDTLGRMERESLGEVRTWLIKEYGDDAINLTIEENNVSWSDVPYLDAEEEPETELKKLTIKFIEYDGRDWFVIDGHHKPTNMLFDKNMYGICNDGTILDGDGVPLTATFENRDWVAVRDIVAKYYQDKKSAAEIKTIADLDKGNIVTDGQGGYARVNYTTEMGGKYFYGHIDESDIQDTDTVIRISDMDEDAFASD